MKCLQWHNISFKKGFYFNETLTLNTWKVSNNPVPSIIFLIILFLSADENSNIDIGAI